MLPAFLTHCQPASFLIWLGGAMLVLSIPSFVSAEDGARTPQPVGSARELVEGLDLEEPMRKAILTVLRQNPDEREWSGRAGSILFAITAQPLPRGRFRSMALPTLLKMTTAATVSQLIQTKSLLSRYESEGLCEANTLRKALTRSAPRLNVLGSVKMLTHLAARKGEFSVALVYASESDIIGSLLEKHRLSIVKAAYRDTMHVQARRLMEGKQWQDALGLWRHLHERKLVSPPLYLDAARCFLALDRQDEAIEIVDEAISTFEEGESWAFFEQAGEIALDLNPDKAQAVAERAFSLALAKYRSHGHPLAPSAKPK